MVVRRHVAFVEIWDKVGFRTVAQHPVDGMGIQGLGSGIPVLGLVDNESGAGIMHSDKKSFAAVHGLHTFCILV